MYYTVYDQHVLMFTVLLLVNIIQCFDWLIWLTFSDSYILKVSWTTNKEETSCLYGYRRIHEVLLFTCLSIQFKWRRVDK